MKRALSAVVGVFVLAMFAQPVAAADMPVPVTKAPAMIGKAPIALFNWTGPYVGVHAGVIHGKTFWQDGPGEQLGSFDDTAAALGLTAGYNWQAPSAPWLFGLEADYSWTNFKAVTGSTAVFDCVNGCTQELDHYVTLRGRAGYVAGPVLYFLSGGAVVGWHHGELLGSASTPGGKSYTKWGWTAGAGIEAALAGNWSAKAEYLYLDFGREFGVCCTGAPPAGSAEYLRAHVFRLGLNYRFATGKAPTVVTKY